MELQHWTLDRFKPYRHNPRRNDEVVDKMVASIAEFGFRMPVVVKSDGTVVDGHLRLKAAMAMELAEVPVVLADELSEEQVKAFRLLANRSANWAEWDEQLLALELNSLNFNDFDMTLTGFSDDELNLYLPDGFDTTPVTSYQSPQVFSRPDATDYGDDDEWEGDEAEEDAPAPAIGGQYPLAIVLTFPEYQRWKAYKDSIGIKRDLQAFLRLLESANMEAGQ